MENRVRIIIEIPSAQAVQGVDQVAAALDGLRGRAGAIDLDAALRVDGTVITKPVQEAGAALDSLGAKSKKAGQDAGAAMASVGGKARELGAGVQSAGEAATTGINKARVTAEGFGASLGGSLGSLAAQAGAVVAAYLSLREVIEQVNAFVQRGLEFDKQMESASLGISSVLAATQEITTLDGRRLDGQEKLNAAISISADLMKDIQVMGIETTATTKELVAGFQTLLGPASAAGMSLQQTEQIVVGMVQAFGAIGIEMNQLSAEGRSLLDGSINPMQDRLATVLGITGEMVKTWKEQGTLFENLNKKLEAFRLAGAETAKTWAGLASNLEESFDLFAGQNTEGIFTGAKQAMTDIIGLMLQFKDGSVTAGSEIQNISAGIQAMSNDIGDGLVSGAQLLVEKTSELNAWIGQNREELSEIYEKLKVIGVSLLESLASLGNMLTTIISVGVETGAFSTALSVAKGIVVLIQESIGYIELAFRAVGLVVVQNVCGPLAQAARLVADLGKTKLGGMMIDAEQMASLEKYAAGQEATVQGFQDALEKAASRYKNTPFPAITAANEAADKRQQTTRGATEASKQFQISAPVGYSAADSEKMLKGSGTAQYQLNKAWSEGVDILAQLQRKIDSGKLSNEDLTRALNDQKEVWGRIGNAQDAYEKKLHRGDKAAANAALAAERYGERASAFYNQTINSLEQLEDSLTGGAEKNANRTDKWFEQQFDTIRQRVIGAKGDVSLLAAAWVALENAWPGDHILAVIKDTTAALKQQASILQDIAQATGDPAMAYEAEKKAAQAWYAEKESLIAHSTADAATKAQELAALQQGYDAKLLAGKANAYKELAAVSSQYWDAEKALLEQHLAQAKANADSEYAYEVYAAQQRSDLRKRELEARIGYEKDFTSTLQDVLADEFGLYKDEITRQHDTWVSLSKDIASGLHDISGSIASSATDAFKGWITGSESMVDAFKRAGDSILDYLMRLLQRMIQYALENYVTIPLVEKFVGSDVANSILGKSGGTSPGGSGSGSGFDLSSLSSLGKLIGTSAGEGLAKDFASAGSSSNGMAMVVGDSNALSNIFADGVDASALGKAAGQLNFAPTSAMASTYSAAETAAMSGGALLSTLGTALGVVGGVAGLVGLATSLFSSSTHTEKTGSGYKIAINAGTLDMSGVDFYKTTTTSGLGGTSTSHSVVNTGAVDPDVAKQFADFLKSTAESLHDFGKELGISTEKLASFSLPEITIASEQLQTLQRNVSNLMAYSVLDDQGLRGAFDFVADPYETYDKEFERLSEALKTVGGYTSAYGYSLQDLAKITQDDIEAIRQVNIETAQNTLPSTLAMAAAMGASSDMLQLLASSATDVNVALGTTDEQLSKILQADYAADVMDALGGPDAFKALMGELVSNMLTDLDSYRRQADYYAGKARESLALLSTAGVTIDTFWTSFDAAIRSGLSVDEFEAWGDAASWVQNFDAISDAIADFYDTLTKVAQNLQARQYKALGWDTAASAYSQITDAGWELSAARKAGYDDSTLSNIAATQQAEVAKALQDVFDSVQGALDDVSGSSAASDLAKLKVQFADWIEAAKILGATEEQLAQIREAEAKVIAGKLQAILDDAQSAFNDAAGGSDMASWLADTKEKFAGWIASAQALEASEAQLAQIRDLETATIKAKLASVLEGVADQWRDATRTETESWLADLRKSMQQATDDATLLGASEAQLAQIRRQESDIIAAKLRDTMAGVAQELASYEGTELTYNVGKLKSDMADALYNAALLGASQADLTSIGTLYAYKIRDAYQQQIDDLVDQLQSAADALGKFGDSIKTFLEGLWTDKNASPLNARGRYVEAQSQFRATAADLSSTDDATRQAAQDKVQDLASTYLTASKDANATFSAYYADFMEVQTVLGASYQQAKSDHQILQEQLDAATGTKENTKTTAELVDQLKSLQQQQGDTWTQMLADLPQAIADAITAAQAYKQAAAVGGGGGGAGLASALAGINSTFIGRDIAAQQANSQYLADKAAQLTQSTGKIWTSYQVLQAIQDAGLTPYQHYQQYGKSEGLNWTDTNAFSSDTNTSYTRFGSSGTTSDGFLSYLDPSNYIAAKALQLSATTGRVWTVDEVAKAFADAGLTPTEHYLQYGQYEGIKAGSGYVGSNDYSAGSSFNATDYLAAKTASLNANNTDGHTWTVAQTAAAIAAAGMTPEQHYQEYGKNEHIPGYAVGGLVGDLARSGGYLPGYSAGDVLTARLRLGEYVFTPEAVDFYGLATMDAMNAMRLPPLAALPGYDLGDTEPLDAMSLPATSLPGYADGGLVGRLYGSSDDVGGTDRASISDGRSTDRGYAALTGSVATLTKAVEKMSDRLDKTLGKVADHTGRVAVMGVKIIESAVAS